MDLSRFAYHVKESRQSGERMRCPNKAAFTLTGKGR
jgi:hypothetical protein